MAAAAPTLKKVFLELGGKSAMVVLDDADFARRDVRGVHDLLARRAGLRDHHAAAGAARPPRRDRRDDHRQRSAGPLRRPGRPKTYMGPLISEKQRDKVHAMVERAVAAGRRWWSAAAGGAGLLLQPTLLVDVDPDSEIAQEETFGPVLAVIAYDDDDDAVRIANDSIYGLSGAVFSADAGPGAGGRPPDPHRHGLVNGGNYFAADAPFGGFKQSGIGREMGVAGLEEFLERKTFAAVVEHPHEARWRASASSRSRCTGSSRRRARCSPTGAPTSSRSSTPSPATRSAGCARPARFASRATPTRTSSTPTGASAASGWTCRCPRAEVLLELARRADVFLTSFLPGHRRKFGIDVDDIRAVNPKIIYARGSALGPRGEESVKGGYDMTAFWCRAGTAATITPPGIEGMIGPPGPAYGDTISGTNLAGGIAAALLKRERTGEPSVVDVSLLGSGLWSMGHTVALTCTSASCMVQPPPGVHGSPINPLVGSTDGRRPLHLLRDDAADQVLGRRMPAHRPPEDWPTIRASRPSSRSPRTPRRRWRSSARRSPPARCPSGASGSPRWPARGRRCRTPCRPPRTRRSGPTSTSCTGELELVANPVQFDVSAPQTGPAPGFAEQTDEILLELGLDWDRIIELKTAGAVT
jgi:hypothetical protein